LPLFFSCTAATAGLTISTDTPPRYYVRTNAQLQGLTKCTSIDYLVIYACSDCTQAAWCGLKLQSITGKDPSSKESLNLFKSPGITSMCGAKQVKGELAGKFHIDSMNSITGLDDAKGITSVGAGTDGSIILTYNPALTSACALANTKYPANTLKIYNNTKLESVPSGWPKTDSQTPANTIPHVTTCGTSGSKGHSGGAIAGILISLVVLAGLLFFLYRRRNTPPSSYEEYHMMQQTELSSSLLKNDSLYPTTAPVCQTSNGSDVASLDGAPLTMMSVPLTTVHPSLSNGHEQPQMPHASLQMPHTSLLVESSGNISSASTGSSGNTMSNSSQLLLLGDWLASLELEQYEYPLGDWLGRQQLSHDRPLSNLEILVMVQDDDLNAGFEELKVEMPHRSAITDALKALKGSAADPRNEST
jgi:hypothetical protein